LFLKTGTKLRNFLLSFYQGKKRAFSRKQKLQAIFVYEGEKEKGQSPFSPMVKAERRKAERRKREEILSQVISFVFWKGEDVHNFSVSSLFYIKSKRK